MSATSNKLNRLRGFYVVFFLVQTAIGSVTAWQVLRALFARPSGRFFFRLRISAAPLLAFSLVVTVALLILGLWIFSQLQQRKNWARVLLLVIGWLAVIGAVLSLLSTQPDSGFNDWLDRLLPGVDWERVAQLNLFTNLISLFFWGYLIYVLQIDPDVKKEFQPPPPPANDGN